MKVLAALAPALLAVAAWLALRQLAAPPSLAPCPSLTWLGLPCAGCGGTRMLLALAKGDLSRAWALNPLWFALLPTLAASLYWAWLHQLWPSRVPASPWTRWPVALAAVLVGSVLLFSLWRSLGGAPPAG